MRHGVGDERRPEPHQNSRNDADDNAFLRGGAARAGQTPVRFAVHDYSDDGASDPGGEQRAIAPGLQNITQNYTDHESNPDGHWKRNGQASHINRGDQKEVGQIENRSPYHCGNDIRTVSGVNIVEETVGVIRGASHGEGENQGNQENADGIVPIEKFETIILDALVGVGPRTPADGAGNHHDERNAQTMRCKHLLVKDQRSLASRIVGVKVKVRTGEL